MKGKYCLTLLLFLAVLLSFLGYLEDNKDSNIVILQIVEHDALNATRRGIEDYLLRCCAQFSIDYENAQGDPTLSLQISKRIDVSQPKLVVALGTVAAQSFLKSGNIPIVFSSVTDPIAAGLVKDLKETETHFTGVSNMIPVEPQLKLVMDILPNAKKLGIIYNSAEINSLEILKKVKQIAAKFDLEIVESVITSSNNVIIATQALANKGVDAIFVSNDNTALSAIKGITKVATECGIPVFCSDVDTINSDILAALGPDQYKIGIQTGKIIEKILIDGKVPAQIPVVFPEELEFRVNMKVARKLKIEIDKNILSAASEVIE